MNPWTERIIGRAVETLGKEGKTVDQAVDMLIGKPKETIDKVALKKQIKDKNKDK